MRRDSRSALAIASLFAGCSVYEPTVLTGEGADGGSGAVTERGGSAGKASGAGAAGKASSGGTPGAANASGGTTSRAGSAGASSGGGGHAGTSGKAGNPGGSAGEAGALGESGAANGGESGESHGGSNGGLAGSSGAAGKGGGSGVGGSNGGAPSTGGKGGGGAGGSAGKGGSASGMSGMSGTSGAEVCSGCARLSVSLTRASDRARFIITMPENTDFTDAVITLRVFRRAGSGGQLRGYLQHGGGPFGFASLDLGAREIADLSGWVDVTYDLGPVTGYDKTIVRRLGIEITGTGASSWTNPTVIYVDSVSIADTELDPSVFPFDTVASVTSTPSTSSPSDQRMWLNSGSGDTNVAASLSWLGP